MILKLHSPTFPRLSDALYRMKCSPAENISPGLLTGSTMAGSSPELSVAVGGVHVTDADILPRSAFAIIVGGQFEKTGPKTSVKYDKIFNNDSMMIKNNGNRTVESNSVCNYTREL